MQGSFKFHMKRFGERWRTGVCRRNCWKKFQYWYLNQTNCVRWGTGEEENRLDCGVVGCGNMLARRFYRCTDEVKITSFKAYWQGLYTGRLWFRCSLGALNALRVQYNNVFRMMFKLPRFCSASEMFTQSRTDGFHAIIIKKVASLVTRLQGSRNNILTDRGWGSESSCAEASHAESLSA